MQLSEFPTPPDARFRKWWRQSIGGDFDLPLGPIARLADVMREIDSHCESAVGNKLFGGDDVRALCFPCAENNHRYHDAHAELYKLIHDSLRKKTIEQLGTHQGVKIQSGDRRTVEALLMLVPGEQIDSIRDALEIVARNRRLATHKPRPVAEALPAFETFRRDLVEVVAAMQSLFEALAGR